MFSKVTVPFYVCVYLIMIVVCNSQKSSDIGHLFIVVICISSSVKCVFKCSAHFLIGLFVFLLLSNMSSLCILDISPLSDVRFANIFFHSVGCLFIFLIVSFEAQKFTIWMNFNLCTFSFWCLCLVPYLKNHYLIPGHKDFAFFFPNL